MKFPTLYSEIIERIKEVSPVQYAKTRNFINGAVTYLSPYISRGVISLPQIKNIVLASDYKPWQIEKFLQELAWREYFQRVLEVKYSNIAQDIKQPQQDVRHHQMITAVTTATTGIEVIDEFIERLYETGYMHNHVRMYVASIVCNMGKAHWRQPAQWLYYHLLDGDIASNNLSWQWVAGTFSSKKYYCNQENINKHTFSTQQTGFLNNNYEHIATMPIPNVLMATHVNDFTTKLPATSLPVIDIAKPTLLYNSYNLDPLWRSDEDVNRILLLEPSHFNQYPVSDNVLSFIIGLSKNINGIQIFYGEIDDLTFLYNNSLLQVQERFISKKHPAFTHYPGKKDSRDWMFPDVTGYYNSFFSYWKKCEKHL
jgi:deoxyribodipyrimidine photo-lyase